MCFTFGAETRRRLAWHKDQGKTASVTLSKIKNNAYTSKAHQLTQTDDSLGFRRTLVVFIHPLYFLC